MPLLKYLSISTSIESSSCVDTISGFGYPRDVLHSITLPVQNINSSNHNTQESNVPATTSNTTSQLEDPSRSKSFCEAEANGEKKMR